MLSVTGIAVEYGLSADRESFPLRRIAAGLSIEQLDKELAALAHEWFTSDDKELTLHYLITHTTLKASEENTNRLAAALEVISC